ncbi:MAG: UPF0280 family protein [Mangrovibacterium sp.]
MLFEAKTYRNWVPAGRFRSFEIQSGDINLWVAVGVEVFQPEMEMIAKDKLNEQLAGLDTYLAEDVFFRKSLKPHAVPVSAPALVQTMAKAGDLAAVGPMAARAAALCELVALELLNKFQVEGMELITECGGDLFLKLNEAITLPLLAGEADISGLMGIEILPEQTPLAVASGSGSKGKPISHGKADAVLVVAKQGAVAGAFAVGLGNLIKSPADVDKVLKRTEVIPEIEGAILILDDQIGLRGDFELTMLT